MSIFNKLQATAMFLVLESGSTHTYCTSGRKYCNFLNNAVFLRNESLLTVSAMGTSAYQSEHTAWLLRSICTAGKLLNTNY